MQKTAALALGLVLLLAGCGADAPNGPTKARERSVHLIEVEVAERTPVRTAHARTGTLRYRRTVRLHAQEEGKVTALPKFESDPVTAGEVVVQLEDDLLRAEFAKAQATTHQARLDFDRIRGLIKKQAAAEDALAQARTAVQIAEADEQLLRSRLGYTRISAPFAAVVTERRVEPGDVVARHAHLLTLADPDSLVIDVAVSELLLPLLREGDPAQIRIDALGGDVHPGRILRIHPELDPLTRQGKVEIRLDPIPPGARAGQFARIDLESAVVNRLHVPFAALRRDRGGEFVFTLADGKAVQTPVRSGLRFRDRIEILEGLEPGQQVITRGFLGLIPGKAVELADASPPATAAPDDRQARQAPP